MDHREHPAARAATHRANVHQQALRQQRLYRRRFGIETSYRQKNQAKAFTTSRDPVCRLLLEGLAHVLRQVQVVLSALLARHGRTGASADKGRWTMALLLDWLMQELVTRHPEQRFILLGTTG